MYDTLSIEEMKDHYVKVRSAFIIKGMSLNKWCSQNSIAIQNVRAAFLGHWKGPKASSLVERVTIASSIGMKH